ncbi:MAG: hypothetical protein QME79_03410 [Bacillota bacterium]|nr:hypothetical protein [Bacillota bacterium]
MPRRSSVTPEDRFLRANLNDPDNQAALLRAYLDLKQTVEELSVKLARANEELSQREAGQAEAARQAREAGRQELAAKDARLERMGQAMRLARWAAEWAAKGGSFLVGARHDLGQVVTVAASSAENCQQVRYDKTSDTWIIVWGDDRPETVIAVSPPKAAAEPPPVPRRRRTSAGG